MQPSKAIESSFQLLPLKKLHESPHNPRKRFRGIEELAASIRQQGIITPLIARPSGNEYELAAGHRRFRAALLAGLFNAPVLVRAMTDEQFMEVITVENLQREDVHPYEEGHGFRELMALPGYDVAAVAGKIGKSESYVRSRLRLLELTPEVAEAFLEDRITFAHARLIAPLAKEKQPEALKACFAPYATKETLEPVSELREWIHDDGGDDLADAKFALDDAELVPAAGACVTCPKSSCAAGKLFGDDNGGEVCYDPKCFDAKTEAHIARKAKAGLVAISTGWDAKKDPPGVLRREEYVEIEIPEPKAAPPSLDPEVEADELESDQKPCEFMEDAVIAAGTGIGGTVKICRNAQCPVHGQQADQARALAGGQGSANNSIDDRREKQKAEERKKKAAWAKRREVYNRIVEKWAPTMDRSVFFLLVVHLLDKIHHKELLESIAVDLGVDKQKDLAAQRAVIYTWAEKAGVLHLRAAFIRLLFVEHIEREGWDRNYDLLAIAQDALKGELMDRQPAPAAKTRKAQGSEWPKPNKHGVYDADKAEKLVFAGKKCAAQINSLQIGEAKWIARANSSTSDGGQSGPLSAAEVFPSMEVAVLVIALRWSATASESARNTTRSADSRKQWEQVHNWFQSVADNQAAMMDADEDELQRIVDTSYSTLPSATHAAKKAAKKKAGK